MGICHIQYIDTGMCLYTQQCTADQTLMSEKHVYIKAVFRHDAFSLMMQRMHATSPAGPGTLLC
jgi:hypothetical protein